MRCDPIERALTAATWSAFLVCAYFVASLLLNVDPVLWDLPKPGQGLRIGDLFGWLAITTWIYRWSARKTRRATEQDPTREARG